jgi:flagellar biogenesis protein FliO
VYSNEGPAPSAALADKREQRRLAPRGKDSADRANRPDDGSSLSKWMPDFGFKLDSIVPTLAALAFVLGLFFLCMWLLRRGAKKRSAILPTEVVSVLGRVSLAPKQIAELLRVGNKLVLVALTPDGAKPITEVTDATEVDRLMGLCHKNDPHSASRAFEHVFRELSRDPAPAGFLGADAPLVSTLPGLPPLFNPRGGTGRV